MAHASNLGEECAHEPAVRKAVRAMNPFDDPDASYSVVVNDQGQHALWPVFIGVPNGWQAVFGVAGREDCLDYIQKNWTDLRPKSLIAEMEQRA